MNQRGKIKRGDNCSIILITAASGAFLSEKTFEFTAAVLASAVEFKAGSLTVMSVF